MASGGYVGRFAPSPTGPLHAGSMVAALASWLDAQAHGGRWLVRIEDVDLPRCVPGADDVILSQLANAGLIGHAGFSEPMRQSLRGAAYESAMARLVASGHAYPCGCTRSDIDAALRRQGLHKQRHGELLYPGTCRPENGGLAGKPARAMRVRTTPPPKMTDETSASGPSRADDCRASPSTPILIDWHDRRLGTQCQDITDAVGDFVLRRADGLWAYQLAVVVDDAEQGVTSIVRGEDLANNTARQIHLQQLLGLARPTYLHTPLVLGANGEKLSKQNGAAPVDPGAPMKTLRDAGAVLGLSMTGSTVADMLASGTREWAARHMLASSAS